MSRKGEESITWFEGRAASDPRFARMLTAAWRHMMSDDVWTRVQAIQAKVDDPLVTGSNELVASTKTSERP